MKHEITPIRGGEVFRMCQRLKKACIPFISVTFDYKDAKGNRYATFKADSWAVKKSQHPFEGCSPAFTLWDSKVRGTALIAFKIY